MAKLAGLLLLVFAINIGLVLIAGQSIPGNSLYNFLINPQDWNASTMLGWLISDIALIGGTALVIGSVAFKNDFLAFAGISTVFLSFGAQLFQLFQWVQSQPIFGGIGPEGFGTWAATFFVSPIVLLYIYTILEFWRGKD